MGLRANSANLFAKAWTSAAKHGPAVTANGNENALDSSQDQNGAMDYQGHSPVIHIGHWASSATPGLPSRANQLVV